MAPLDATGYDREMPPEPHTAKMTAGVSPSPEGGRPVGPPMSVLPPSLKPPVPIYTPEAEFSDLARRHNYQGMVLIRVLVDEDGLPRLVGLMAGAGMGLDEKALEAVRKYKFKPATLEGIPVPFLMSIEVNFRL